MHDWKATLVIETECRPSVTLGQDELYYFGRGVFQIVFRGVVN